MSKDTGFKIRNNDQAYFITFAVVEWVDVFTRKLYADIVIESLKYCQQEKGLVLHAWCLMSNHLHLLISTKNKDICLSDILRDFKKYTSKKIIEAIQNNSKESRRDWMLQIFKQAGSTNSRNKIYQFWRQDNHPVEVFSIKFIGQKLDYIHKNPVQAGIVEKPEEYIYSSAKNYIKRETGLLEIEYI